MNVRNRPRLVTSDHGSRPVYRLWTEENRPRVPVVDRKEPSPRTGLVYRWWTEKNRPRVPVVDRKEPSPRTGRGPGRNCSPPCSEPKENRPRGRSGTVLSVQGDSADVGLDLEDGHLDGFAVGRGVAGGLADLPADDRRAERGLRREHLDVGGVVEGHQLA